MSVNPRFGPYELVRRLGIGGMAETYLAVRRGPAGFVQHVCVKRILSAFESDPEFVRQFLDEARLAATLRHANIAQVVDFGEVDGSHYLALELVDGMDLRELFLKLRERGARLDPPLVTLIALDLAAALEFAHTPSRGRHAVVHRDVSPSNVLVSRAGDVYLTDFGIARTLGAKRVTESGIVRGKVPYMAPEYALRSTFDGRTDLFGVGVMLYEALAGQRPFDGMTDLDTLQRIQTGSCEPLATFAPSAPRELVAAIEILLRPDPDERFPTAAQLVEALAPVSPPATARRQLAELVRSFGESLSASLRISSPNRTAALPADLPPSYPDVVAASADARTRTSDIGMELSEPAPPGPAEPDSEWAVTDPQQMSQHDRASPRGEAAPVIPVTSPSLEVPTAARMATSGASLDNVASPHGSVELPVASTVDRARAMPYSAPEVPSRRSLFILLAVLGVLAFAAATVGTYAVVVAWQTGALY